MKKPLQRYIQELCDLTKNILFSWSITETTGPYKTFTLICFNLNKYLEKEKIFFLCHDCTEEIFKVRERYKKKKYQHIWKGKVWIMKQIKQTKKRLWKLSLKLSVSELMFFFLKPVSKHYFFLHQHHVIYFSKSIWSNKLHKLFQRKNRTEKACNCLCCGVRVYFDCQYTN